MCTFFFSHKAIVPVHENAFQRRADSGTRLDAGVIPMFSANAWYIFRT